MAIGTSFVYAAASASIALTLTIIYYYYSLWYRNSYQFIGYILIVIPLFFPLLVYALALKMVSAKFLIPEYASILVGHISIIIPIQYFILEGSNEKIKMDWLYSSSIMGAKHREIIIRIVFPNISKTLIVAFACGFLYSFDEIVISNFLIDSGNITVPKKIWLEINRDINPNSGVIYVTLLIISALVVLFVNIYSKLKFEIRMRKKRKSFLFRDVKSSIISGVIVFGIDLGIELLILGHISVIRMIVAFIVGVVIYEIWIQQIQIYRWGGEIIDKIYLFRKEEHIKYRDLAVGMLSHKLDQSISELHDFFHNPLGVSVSIIESEKLSELLFERNKGFYYGTDSNVPSKFKELYPNYLINSQQSKSSIRILLCSNKELNDDFHQNKNEFVEFYNWHVSHNVTLLTVNKTSAELKRNTMKLANTDIGIWDDDYVVIFKPEPPNIIHYWFKSYHTLEESKRYVKFFIGLLNEAKQIKISNSSMQIDSIAENRKEEISYKLKQLWNI